MEQNDFENFHKELIIETFRNIYALDKITQINIYPTLGGVNNITKKIIFDNNEYIVRIYNNGNDLNKVILEHEVLEQLNNLNLSFKIPKAIKSYKTGSPYVHLSRGGHGCIFEVIPGDLPDINFAYEIGKATGELSQALSLVNIENLIIPTPPYYEIYKSHESITKEIFFEFVSLSDDLKDVKSSIDYLIEEIKSIEVCIEELHKLNLPKQLIHGDIHYDNVLVLNKTVSGILDFEFCSIDWRAMELAICLSKYASDGDKAMKYFSEFIKGYFETYTYQFTRNEIDYIPQLIILRILSNTIYFVGRAISGEDSINVLTTRVEVYANRVRWLKEKNKDIINLLIK